jgi:hypothetical protein
MIIEWESTSILTEGTAASAYQDEKGKLHIVYLPPGSGQPNLKTATIALGIWNNLTLSEPVAIAPDNNVISTNIFQQPDDNVWFVWETAKQHRIAVLPDTGEIYDPESVYRLYYAVDTEKLYMNISETWQFIGSPNIQQLIGYQEVLDGAPIYDDTDLQQRLEALELAPAPVPYDDGALIARLEALEATPPGTYDDSAIQQAIVDLDARLDTLEAGPPPPVEPVWSGDLVQAYKVNTFASSIFGGGYEADKAFDVDDSTVWYANGAVGHIGIELTTVQNVTRVELMADPARTKNVTIEGSNDNALWTPITNIVMLEVTTLQQFTFENPNAYKYYRFVLTGTLYSGSNANFNTIKMYKFE